MWLTAAVVVIDTVAFAGAVPEMLSEGGTRQVGASVVPDGPLTVQPRFTVPVKPFPGTIATVVLPVSPGATLTLLAGPTSVMPGPAVAIVLWSRAVRRALAVPFHDAFRTP